ncbi:hypothetical protein BS50DRAFT_641860 [Corynespora cassiicola Philippines]|uniref:Uncharacterized protein n=1 Tax=Corynespora cassiicola Philippines TaxID=1448308 RepID=A0A2T2P942_CORCC|nr:hypothetical protein BS50DRAFT_641860 [Corynespora cassiicola Philippines]
MSPIWLLMRTSAWTHNALFTPSASNVLECPPHSSDMKDITPSLLLKKPAGVPDETVSVYSATLPLGQPATPLAQHPLSDLYRLYKNQLKSTKYPMEMRKIRIDGRFVWVNTVPVICLDSSGPANHAQVVYEVSNVADSRPKVQILGYSRDTELVAATCIAMNKMAYTGQLDGDATEFWIESCAVVD